MRRKVCAIFILATVLILLATKTNPILAAKIDIKPILHYDFEGDKEGILDKVGDNNGFLHGKATIVNNNETNSNALYLNGITGSYAEFPQGFFDGKTSLTISMDVLSKMDNQNFFTFSIGKDNNKYLFLRTRMGEIRYAITKQSYQNEQDVTASGSFKDVWTNITLVMTSLRMQLYINGELVDEQLGLTTSLSQLGRDLFGYIGKSFYDGDGYFKGYIDDVKVFDKALSAKDVATLLNVEMSAFHKITAKEQSVVGTEINKDKKEAIVYISKSRSKSIDEIELEIHLNEGVRFLDNENIIIKLNEEKEVTFVIENEQDGILQEEMNTWKITTRLSNNPIFSGQYADPDIDVFQGKYYIYGTTDGFSGWSGTKFHVLSSDNLVDWVNEGVILDVASNDVKWAVGNAWAPSIEEKNGKYYFYFCAKDSKGDSSIGVAVADSPTGPFIAQEEALITKKLCTANGIVMGQAIDPSIFTDEDGSSYMLFGNGNAAIVKLNEDMVSVDFDSIKNYTGVKGFREAITVTKRDDIYHFTWSCDDTGSANYHVNYGVSDNIYGPINFKYTILEKDVSKDILGTGHHSILNIPNTDDYYIAYHRFYTPLGSFTDGYGHHRELCIDKLFFDDTDGLMKPISPTHIGVEDRLLNTDQINNELSENNNKKMDSNRDDDNKDIRSSEKENERNQTSNTNKKVTEYIVTGILIFILLITLSIILVQSSKNKKR